MRLSRFVFFTIACTFVLILMGGVVHTTGSSLACPDWPLCYGSALPTMEGKVAVEHSHRLVASGVGLFTIVVCAWILRRRERYPGLAPLGVLALVLVVTQGVLGGLTVIFKLPPEISTAHLGMSQLFLATLLVIGLRARRLEQGLGAPPALTPRLRGLLRGTAIALYVQMLLGALMRHVGGAMACVELPLCRDQLYPDDAHWIVQLHMTHRLWGVVTACLTIALGVAFARARVPGLWKALAIAVPVLALVQITLGVFAILTFLGLPVVTAHLGVAASMWSSLVTLLVLSAGRVPARVPARATSEAGAAVVRAA